MGKRCKNCDYNLGDMCRFWQKWRRNVYLKNCSEQFIKRCVEEKAIQYQVMGIGPGTSIIDSDLMNKIGEDMFKPTKEVKT